ncbi:MAG: hypothetical protein NZ561_00335 [Phycisphaerae bacterium]|nr:hypothetical protein [Phycisphaerae bacterium]MDW8263620.1 hypothetical protein [Phycisphaerales bacterium]
MSEQFVPTDPAPVVAPLSPLAPADRLDALRPDTAGPERSTSTEVTLPVQSPPPTARPPEADSEDPRASLCRLSTLLSQQRSTRLLLEYLRLRRMVRAS